MNEKSMADNIKLKLIDMYKDFDNGYMTIPLSTYDCYNEIDVDILIEEAKKLNYNIVKGCDMKVCPKLIPKIGTNIEQFAYSTTITKFNIL